MMNFYWIIWQIHQLSIHESIESTVSLEKYYFGITNVVINWNINNFDVVYVFLWKSVSYYPNLNFELEFILFIYCEYNSIVEPYLNKIQTTKLVWKSICDFSPFDSTFST